MKKLIDLFIEKTKWVHWITIAITVAGLAAVMSMKKDLHPAFKFNYVQISLSYPNASADEIEKLITFPLEERLRNLSDIEQITSRTRVGAMYITLAYPQSVKNINDRIIEVRNAIEPELRLLPSSIRNLQVRQAGDSQIFLANIGVTGIDETNFKHHAYIETLANKIKSVSGIAEVDSSLEPFHIFIEFDREKMRARGVTLAQLRKVLREELSGNAISHNTVSGKSWLLEFADEPVDLKRIEELKVFRNSSGRGTLVKDVARLEHRQLKNSRYQFLLNGAPGVEISVFKSENYDSIETFEKVQEEINKLTPPDGVSTRVLYDGPYFIQQQIDVLLSNGFGGLLLVLLMLSLAMGWRTAMMTAVGLPISYLGTFIILKALGISIDLISLMAMILVVGNLVDDAVIFAEKYNQLLEEGLEPKLAASTAAKELIVPVSGTILTIIFAFMPIIILDSELSVIFFALPVVISVALFLSWFETFFILPNHLHHYIKKPTAEKATVFFHWLSVRYQAILKHTLRFRYLYGFASLFFLGYSFYQASKMSQDFSLSINAPQVELAVVFDREYDFNQTMGILKPIHDKILALPKDELDFVETNIGWLRRQGKTYRGPQYATVRLVLSKKEVDTKTLREKVQQQTQEIVDSLPKTGIKELVVMATERNSEDRKKNISTIEIAGKDQLRFEEASRALIARVQEGSTKVEYVQPDHEGPETFRFVLDRNRIYNYGLAKTDISSELAGLTGPFEVAEVRSQDRWMNIYLIDRFPLVPQTEELQKMKIQPFSDGQKVALSELGHWVAAGISESIEHKNGQRVLKVDFRYDGKKTNEQIIKKELAELIKPIAGQYSTLDIKVVDANEQDKKGREWALKVVLIAGLSIYLILAITLGSWLQPFIVGLPIPFAIMGVIWALKLHDMSLGLMVMIGLIGTMGVAVNDSIVMVHQINLLWKKYGVRSAELVIRGAASRLRAIVLTASCTLIGVFPTAYGLGGESGFTQPLAFSMGWGLSTSLALTLFIIPAMLMVLNDVRGLLGRMKSFFSSWAAKKKLKVPVAEKIESDISP